MTETIAVALLFLTLLGLEWRYHLRSLRVGTVLLAVIVLFFAQSSPTVAIRHVFGAPPESRVTELRGSQVTDYQSGILTMAEAISEQEEGSFPFRLIGLGVLIWLACSPALRRARGRKELSSTGV